MCIIPCVQLSEFITSIGDEKASKLFRVPVRTVRSWRYRARRPLPVTALRIIKVAPVTWEEIYGRS